MRASQPPCALGRRPPGRLLPLLLAGAVIATGGPTSPVLMWFALPAVTLGARFEPRGMVVGTAYLLAVFLGQHRRRRPRRSASAHRQDAGRRRRAGRSAP